MKRLSTLLMKPRMVFCAMAVALALITLCFFIFRMQVNSYIGEDMRSQIEAVQKNSALIVQNEMNYLKRLTTSTAQIMSRVEIQTDEDILQALRDYATAANVVRTLFVTLDGHAYTSYAGYLGQSDADTSIDGIALSEITTTTFTQPHYDQDLDEVVWGVVAPVMMGKMQGVLASSYNIKDFSNVLENKFIDGLAEIGIVNSKGEVVSGKTINDFNINIFDRLSNVTFKSSSVNTMQTNFASGKDGFCIYQVDGIRRYCSYAPIEQSDWYIVVTVKESFLRSKFANLERYGFQLTVELVIIMLLLLCVIMASRQQEQKKIRMILEQAAMIDGLTGIYNRKATEDEIEKLLKAAGEETGTALLVIDVDNFKKINDECGHLLGDNVLRECANRLKDVFGEDGIVGRVGGDEFAVFLPCVQNTEQIEERMSQVTRNFCVPTSADEIQHISISTGIAQAGHKGHSFLALYQMADAALYRAKQAGKGRIST